MSEYKPTPTGLTRRQFLTLAGGVTTGALLAACAPSTSPTTSSDTAGPAADEVTNLIAWFTDRRTINEMTESEAIPDFQTQNADITVEMQFVPESELQQKLLTANAAGNAPDISSIDETFLDTLTKQEVLRPIPEETINVSDEMGELTAFHKVQMMAATMVCPMVSSAARSTTTPDSWTSWATAQRIFPTTGQTILSGRKS